VRGAVLWGVAYGAAPTLLQTALIGASGAINDDAATAVQTTMYNVEIAAGSLLGGVILGRFGAGLLPWDRDPGGRGAGGDACLHSSEC
jgi:predicted MFS family arabinose efflux permease